MFESDFPMIGSQVDVRVYLLDDRRPSSGSRMFSPCSAAQLMLKSIVAIIGDQIDVPEFRPNDRHIT